MSIHNKVSNLNVPPGFEHELNNIAIDFDGVIHTFDKGFHDGTCYGDPIDGAKESLETLSKTYRVIIFTAKARPDRPLVKGKTGLDLVWEWLRDHDMDQYVAEVTHEKPRAEYYIDDKGIRFLDWNSTMEFLNA